jgi:uncharacterized protein YecE (DUF72 family)
MGAKVYLGTSGYSYDDWVGPFYPQGTGKAAFLEYYASRFSMVELNFTYYRQPDSRALQSMLAATREDFLFSIKVHKSLTHEVEADWKKAAYTYLRGVNPLVESERLAGVLLQFPFSFHYAEDNRRYLGQLCDELKELPLVIEFRNSAWQRKSVYDELKNREIATTVVDCPPLEKLPKPDAVTTSDIGYIRFHGRNSANWWDGTNASRYDYLYSDAEFDKWLDKIADMSGNTAILLIAFNNHWRGQAVRNAEQLGGLLREKTELEIVYGGTGG